MPRGTCDAEPIQPSLPAVAALALKSNEELWQLTGVTMAWELQDRLEALAAAKKSRSLSQTEEAELAHLMEEAQEVMLRKAEVFRLLALRGHAVLGDTDRRLCHLTLSPAKLQLSRWRPSRARATSELA